MKYLLWLAFLLPLIKLASSVDPKFDPSTRMKLVLVPADAVVGSVIYRLRATDEEFDYPLTFELVGDQSSSVEILTLPCTKYNSVCQANVVLKRRLEPGRYYDFQVSVKDTRGGMASQSCSLTATNFTTPIDTIFPHKPGIIMTKEDTRRGAELAYVIARKNPLFPKGVYLELWGSPLFAIRQKIVSPEMTEGTIFLLGPLDFEKQAMYHLTVLAIDAYAEPGQDTRNIAALEVVIIVEDIQDVPPVFSVAPPVTRIPSGLLPGDKVTQVHAEDGDRGSPREIRYGLVSEGNPFTSFFDINETSGEISLLSPLDDISAIIHIGDPVLLTVIAEEVKVSRDEPPAMSTTVQLAFLLPERSNSPPYFDTDHYVARIEENAPQGTALIFPEPYLTRVSDDDAGKNGVFSLTLLGNNGTFEISPNVAERQSNFIIRVRDNHLLNYEENMSLDFQILAQELGPATNLSALVNVTVYITDINDNPPVFTETIYTAELPENTTAGTRVVQVQADDVDTGMGGRVRYTQILGFLNTSLNLDATTGIITISTDNHGFDREMMQEYHFYVEARDNDGTGNRVQVPLVLKLIDVNDETPIFERNLYEFILSPNLQNFTVPAFIKAIDNDAEPPNNVVRYELIKGNYENKFLLHTVTGELTLREPLMKRGQNVRLRRQTTNNIEAFVLTARAFDLGVPVRDSLTIIRVYPPESRTRTSTFIVPGLNPDRQKTEETLADITGGRVIIQDIRPYTGNIPDATDIGGNSRERSVVIATVLYDGNSVVDVAKIQDRLSSTGREGGGTIISRDDMNTATMYKAENRILFWILIFLALLIALVVLTLLLCCICSWCPLYGATRKNVIRVNSAKDDVHLVHREMEIGKQSKSVQVAEWMGRREAWSAERSTDSRTKTTRWEFSRLNAANRQKIEHENPMQIDDDESDKNIIVKSADQRSKILRNDQKKLPKTNKMQIHNSRTNLITDHDVRVEDVIEDREYQSLRREQNLHVKHSDENQIDDDSMRRHEMDRGSDIEYEGRRASLKRQQAEDINTIERDQLFIKEGNAEILRLVTRGKNDDDNIYVNVPPRPVQPQLQPQYIMVDNAGKEILMRRYIEEQANGKQIITEHYQVIPGASNVMQQQAIPNEVQSSQEVFVTRSQMDGASNTYLDPNQPEIKNEELKHASSTHSIIQQELENSLKQQNLLLRQILLEREKLEEKYNQQEHALETQSLPGHSMAIATQTDCETGTQTSPLNAKMERRRARSENDDSMSEDDYEYIRYSPANSPDGGYYLKKRRHRKKLKNKEGDKPRRRIVMVDEVKRKIRTPIQEENEDLPTKSSSPTIKRNQYETRSSILRRLKNQQKAEIKSKSPGLKKDILIEIADSLDKQTKKKSHKTHKTHIESDSDEKDGLSTDSLEDYYEIDEAPVQVTISKNSKSIIYSKRGSNNDLKEISKDSKKSIKHESYSVPNSTKRISRKDNESFSKKKDVRQATSEPPTRSLKGQAPQPPSKKVQIEKTTSETDLTKEKSVPRYMEWYFNKNQETPDKDKNKIKIQIKKPAVLERNKKKTLSKSSDNLEEETSIKNRLVLKEDIQNAKNFSSNNTPTSNHPLLQHSEHRFEHHYDPGPEISQVANKLSHYMFPQTPPSIKPRETKTQLNVSAPTKPKPSPIKEEPIRKTKITKKPTDESKQLNASTLEDDHDSGIAMSSLLNSMKRRNPITDKKSVFAIAYDDVRIKQIEEAESPPVT